TRRPPINRTRADTGPGTWAAIDSSSTARSSSTVTGSTLLATCATAQVARRGHRRDRHATRSVGPLRRERAGADVHAGLGVGVLACEPGEDVDDRIRGRTRGRPAATDQGDDAAGEFGHVDPHETT